MTTESEPVPLRTSRARRQYDLARGQTEPLAALVAVASVCLALSVYTGVLASVVPEFQDDRDVTTATADRLWHEITETGVYYAHPSHGDSNKLADISPSALPDGYNVAITITVVGDDGRTVTVAERRFDGQGVRLDEEPPTRTDRFERPVTVSRTPGDLRPGTFTVEVWE